MKKLLLIDGNSMLFRAYYATSNSQIMQTTKGISTNAIYGFALMLAKALSTIQPDYALVAFDHGKDTFRHLEYAEYKGTRSETPTELKMQFPIIREYLDAIHLSHYEQAGLEADDIIGCLAKQSSDYQVNVLTSDKDLLQLVDDNITIHLMHKGITDIVSMDTQAVVDRFNLQPKQIIDLKGLAGDSSDNIIGVKGVGDKTATKLINQYNDIEGLYQHIDEISGKLKEKLVEGKESAFFSKRLATIITEEKIDVEIEKCTIEKEGIDAYNFYNKYEMKSLANRVVIQKEETKIIPTNITFAQVNKLPKELMNQPIVIYLNDSGDYLAVIGGQKGYDISFTDFIKDKELLTSDNLKVVYDIKRWLHLAIDNDFVIAGKVFDLMITSFLCDTKIKNINALLGKYDLLVNNTQKEQLNLFDEERVDLSALNSYCQALNSIYPQVNSELIDKNMEQLYYEIELPLASVLVDMEHEGIRCDEQILDSIATETKEKMDYYQENVYRLANKEFNLNSPKQLAEVIYDDLQLTKSTKRSTDAKVLAKLVDRHPIVSEILQYRKYAKIYSTYAFGLKKYIQNDGKIHTVYNQCIAETGRLSSSDPNLQNISIRSEEASFIRKAFLPMEGCVLVGADYSQVELRVLAHLAQEVNLIEAFKAGYDIHTKTAMDIFNVSQENVTPIMRRQAKAINFGIDYGMSPFGLAEQLGISVPLASQFINSYYAKYPNIQIFMHKTIEDCQRLGYVTTMANRRREIPEINSSNKNLQDFGKRAAMNAPIQGSAADLIKIAMINVANKLKETNKKSKLILQIHDELILNVPFQEKEEVMKLVQQEMENAMQLSVPLVAQATSGANWLEVK